MMKLLTKLVELMLLLLFTVQINSNQYISVFLQRSYGTCNKRYCNISIVCRPLNRTSKWYSMDIQIRPEVQLEATIYIELIAFKKFRTIYRQHMLKLKTEMCAQLKNADHPFFKLLWKYEINGNVFDPCPISGHRYVKPYVPSYDRLVPVGEWRVDTKISKNVNDSEVIIATWSEFYEVKPTSAVEF